MHTQVGKLITQVREGDLRNELHEEGNKVTDDERNLILSILQDSAHFVIDDKLLDVARDPKTEKSAKQMVAAGIRALPFDPMLIEFSDVFYEGARSFVRLQTTPIRPVHPQYIGDIYAYVYCVMKRVHPEIGTMIMSLRPGVPIPIMFDDVLGFRAMITHNLDTVQVEHKAMEHIGLTAVAAMLLAMLMLNTRGIITERVSMGKVNRNREKHGKPRFNDYTVVRIGHIYDRQGNAHDPHFTGRHMPVHWRCAHVRNVRYGPRNQEPKHRPVLIPACLVNYESEDEYVPLPHKEVTM